MNWRKCTVLSEGNILLPLHLRDSFSYHFSDFNIRIMLNSTLKTHNKLIKYNKLLRINGFQQFASIFRDTLSY